MDKEITESRLSQGGLYLFGGLCKKPLVADLSELQQDLLWEFALEFLQIQTNHSVDLAAVRADLANSRVWWFGDIEDEEADLYVRVQSDRYLIELLQSNTFGVLSEVASNHVHASFRDLTNDWD